MEEIRRKLRALIVDDEIDICFLLTGILNRNNLQTKFVNTLSQAKKELATEQADILLLDNHLPDGLGINFVQEAKLKYPNLKIIMLTAYDTSADKEEALKEGVDQFIGKPFTSYIIKLALEQVMN